MDDEPGEDHGAHGSFDDRAVRHSPQLWASQHHGLLATSAAGLTTVVGALTLGRRRRRGHDACRHDALPR